MVLSDFVSSESNWLNSQLKAVNVLTQESGSKPHHR